MSRELPDLLPSLDPPPGGLERLRARMRLERDNAGARGPLFERVGLVLVPAATIAVVAAMTIFAPLEDHLFSAGAGPSSFALASDPALIRFGLAPRPSDAVEIMPARRADTAVSAVSATSEVAFYWMESTALVE